jgi:hypothetical protein
MKLNHLAFSAALILAGCSHDPAGIRIAHEAPAVATTPAPAARVEPVFYNGKTYQVSLAPAADGTVGLSIAGMAAAQAKDAAALTSSTLHHFACKDSQKAVLQAPPAFATGIWRARGRCV